MKKLFCRLPKRVGALGQFALCAVFILTAAGCSVNDSSSSEGKTFTEDSYSKEVINPEEPKYSWIMQPTVSADNIISFDGSQVDPDDESNHAYANYSVIRRDGKYGLIDYSGALVIEPEYEDYYTCWCGEVTLVNYIDQRKGMYEYCTVDSSNQVVYYAPEHNDNSPEYFWANDKIYVKNKNEEMGTVYDGKKTVVVGEADVKDNGDGTFTVNPKEGSLYGLAKKGKLLGNIEFSDYYAPSYKGAGLTCIALKNAQGKWGFVNSSGKTIIDFICDGDDNAYGGFLIDNAERSHPYLYTGDYVPVNIDGSYAYYDKNGECVVNVGEFEQARPVHNGRAWVKKNGLWGIIQLGEIVKDESSAAEETTQTQQQTTTDYYDYNYNNNNYYTEYNTQDWQNQTTQEQTTEKQELGLQQEQTKEQPAQTEAQITQQSSQAQTQAQTKEQTQKQTEAQTQAPQTQPAETPAQ